MRRIDRRGCLFLGPLVLAGAGGFGALWPALGERLSRWLAWYQDATPPQLVIRVPDRPVRGKVTIVLEVADEQGWEIEWFELDGLPLPAVAGEHVIDTTTLPDGLHVLAASARDHARAGNRAQVQATLLSRNHPPILALDPASTSVGQGQTLVIRVRSSVPVALSGTFAGRSLVFVSDGQQSWALVGIDAMTRPGPRPLRLTAVDELGNRSELNAEVRVLPVAYPNEEVWLPPATSGLIGSTVNAREIARLDALFAQVSPQPRWSGPFVRPVSCPIASDFATGRSYNGGPITSRHWGTDFDCPVGTPVFAPAPGTVVLVEPLAVRGLAVILDHGVGVYSCYYHLSRADVHTGAGGYRRYPSLRSVAQPVP
ncbi:MAG: hypothetical protein KatS3mg061_0659 [Dehalococcoidia bacterium]|nr:MAG: hypothetical protein KatS3mg061_0659 [Dehalococcoidia bacterium]